MNNTSTFSETNKSHGRRAKSNIDGFVTQTMFKNIGKLNQNKQLRKALDRDAASVCGKQKNGFLAAKPQSA